MALTSDGDPQLASRFAKTHPQIFKGADWTLWIDCRFRLDVDPVPIAEDMDARGIEFAALRHPDRDHIADEVEAILALNKAPEALLRAQLAHYEAKGFTDQQRTLTTSGGFLLRKNTPRMREFNRLWWEEQTRWTLRDQMSLDYCAKKAGVKVHYLEGHYRDNPYSSWSKTW